MGDRVACLPDLLLLKGIAYSAGVSEHANKEALDHLSTMSDGVTGIHDRVINAESFAEYQRSELAAIADEDDIRSG